MLILRVLGNPPLLAIFLVLCSSLNGSTLLLLYSCAVLPESHQLPRRSLGAVQGGAGAGVRHNLLCSRCCRHQFMSHLIYPGAFQQQASLVHSLFLAGGIIQTCQCPGGGRFLQSLALVSPGAPCQDPNTPLVHAPGWMCPCRMCPSPTLLPSRWILEPGGCSLTQIPPASLFSLPMTPPSHCKGSVGLLCLHPCPQHTPGFEQLHSEVQGGIFLSEATEHQRKRLGFAPATLARDLVPRAGVRNN